jgi:DNA repair protein RecO (recombination protein O)
VSEKATALVLRVIEFSETSCVLTLFSREFGKVRALAKGARRPKSPFESALDLLALCRIVFLRKSSGALDLLTEAKLERRFRPGGRDLAAHWAGYYVAELLDALTDDYDPHPQLFDAAEEALTGLAAVGPVSLLFRAKHVLRFELVALRVLGHLPSVAVCVDCGTDVALGGRTAFSSLAGGVLCNACRPRHRGVVGVSASATVAIARLANFNERNWLAHEVSPATCGELRGVLNHYLAHLVGKPLRMHPYLTASFKDVARGSATSRSPHDAARNKR